MLLTKTGTVPVLSSEVKANQINDCKISYIDINRMFMLLKSDPLIASIDMNNNKIDYETVVGDKVSIEIGESRNIQTIIINDNNKKYTVSINPGNNLLYLNGKQVLAKYILEEELNSKPASRGYTLMGTIHPNITAEDAIRKLPASVLFTLMFSAMGGIGVALSLAQVIIDAFIAINSSSKTVYVTRKIYRNSDYTVLKYDDTYYKYSSYSGKIKSKTTYVYQ